VPSYRVTAAVGLLQPGVAAPDVLPQAVATAEAMTTVEAYDVAVVRGQARVTVLTTDAFDEDSDHYELTVAGGLGSLTIDRG